MRCCVSALSSCLAAMATSSDLGQPSSSYSTLMVSAGPAPLLPLRCSVYVAWAACLHRSELAGLRRSSSAHSVSALTCGPGYHLVPPAAALEAFTWRSRDGFEVGRGPNRWSWRLRLRRATRATLRPPHARRHGTNCRRLGSSCGRVRFTFMVGPHVPQSR